MHKLEFFEAVICLNGRLLDREFFERVLSKKILLIAADGSYHTLKRIGVNPDFVVGDMDSVGDSVDLSMTQMHADSDQYSTDFEKVLFFLRSKGISKILVLGMNGGEIDHVINNTNTFLRYSDQFDMCFYDEPDFGESKIGVAVNGKIDLDVGVGKNISLFSFDEGKICTKGMTWEVSGESFNVMKASAARNRSKERNVSVSTTGDKLLAIYSGTIR